MIVLLGGSGYVGSAFRVLFQKHDVPHRVLSRAELDYTQPDRLEACLRELQSTALINAAGYTGKPNVDACEDHKMECLDGNAVLPGKIARACAEAGIPWGHVSSGCIYTGCRPDGSGFREEDPPNFSFRQDNCSFYSGSKALGEEILDGAPRCYIWRLRIPFNHLDHPRNYLTKLMRYDRLLEAVNSLSHLDEFAEAAWRCLEEKLPFGTYNLTNPGAITTREITELMRRTGVCDRAFEFFASEEEFMRQAARAPRSNCVLDTKKAAATGLKMREVHEAVEDSLKNWSS